jgi:hypothetical protein
VAEGAFAPGHLGELTQFIPFEMVDAVLAETRRTQARVRDLPARVVVYLVLAGCLFTDRGYRQVGHRLVAGLGGLAAGPAIPTAAALTQARQRLGAAPLRALFELLRGPAATTRSTAGVWWRGLLVTAIDGTTMTVADTAANLGVFTKQASGNGGSGYPLLRLLAVVCCGTRTVIDATFGSALIGETTYAPPLLARSLRTGMIVLADRGFATQDIITAVTSTGAHLLIRCKANRKLPTLQRHSDGSYLSMWNQTPIRVIEAEITIATSNGSRTGSYRLITTLLDPRDHPALDLVKLYHQRWEIETTYLAIKSTVLGGQVLRARTPEGITQEVYALLITYQILRQAMTYATDTQPGTDPDRASFTVALNAARDQLVQAAGVIADNVIDLVGHIGQLVLTNLLPPRRLRLGPRAVKRATSKYRAIGPNINRTTHQATINIHILAPPT